MTSSTTHAEDHPSSSKVMRSLATTTTTRGTENFPPSSSSPSPSLFRRFFLGHGGAATLGGLCEIIVFHPFDTMAKRLMTHRERVVDTSSLSKTYHNFYCVIFGGISAPKQAEPLQVVEEMMKKKRERQSSSSEMGGGGGMGTERKVGVERGIPCSSTRTARLTLWEKVKYLYPGSKYAVMYKVSQRVVKFAGQPVFREYLHTHYHSFFFPPEPPSLSSSSSSKSSPQQEGKKKDGGRGGVALELVSGSLIGVSETILLPFDRMKVLHQTTSSSSMKQHKVASASPGHHIGLLSTMRTYGVRKLYAGAVTTATRNAVGTSLFFAGTAISKEYLFGLQSGNYKETTFAQNLLASTVGGVVGVVATSPMDVVKTRIQGQRLEGNISGWQIFTETCKKEGLSAFYKGITPKVLTSAPKLVFGYTMTQFFLKYLTS